ncbi:MAG: patatin-like phospholipase family protein [Chloroflexota bacterium]
MEHKVGLVLGGGGARGLAHIGVLRIFERERIPIDCIAGTSIGGLVGALYAAGIPVEELEQEVAKLGRFSEQLRLVDVSISTAGLSVRGRRIYNYMADLLGDTLTFVDLQIPVAMVAVDLKTGRDVILQGGLVIDAVRASISIPGIFMPVELADYRLVDGGVLNNVPVNVALDLGATKTIAVDVLPTFSPEIQVDPEEILPLQIPFAPLYLNETYHVLMIMIAAITAHRLSQTPPDLLIRPVLPTNVSLLAGFHHSGEIIAAGEAAAEAALPAIRELLDL